MEYNKSQFIKSDDKKVLHKVKKQWVVLSMSLLALLGGGAVAHQTVSHADVNHHQSANPETTLKNQINASLTKAQANQNQSATQVSVHNNQQATPQQISQQANILHNRILQNADLTANSAKPANSNDEQQSNGSAVHSDSIQGHSVNNQPANINGKSVQSNDHTVLKPTQPLAKAKINNKTVVNHNVAISPVHEIGNERVVGSSEQPITGQWGSSTYILNGSNLRVVGGQITRFHDFAQAHPNDPLVQNENKVANVTFSDVQAPTNSSAYNMKNYPAGAGTVWQSDFQNTLAHNNAPQSDNGELFPNQEKLLSIDASGLNTSGTNDMLGMFGNMGQLTTLKLGNSFDTSNVHDMNSMFHGDRNLSSLDVSGFNTSRVRNMDSMFESDNDLPKLDVSHFDTHNVTSMRNMFWSDKNVTKLDVSHFDTNKVTDMAGMFDGTWNLSDLDVSHFDVSNVTTMDAMFESAFFYAANPVTLNLSNFDTSKVTNMGRMFNEANLKKIILTGNFDTLNVKQTASMFANLPNIHSIGYSPLNDIVLGNRFQLKNGTNYGTWDYSDVVNGHGPSDADNWMSDGTGGMFASDFNLSDLTLSHLHPGQDASSLIEDDSNLNNINLSDFYLTGPKVLSKKGSYKKDINGYVNLHPGIYNIPGIDNSDVNPYKDYDMLKTDVSDQGLVSIKLGNKITFKKDPSVDPNQSDNENNYLNGTFYSVTPSDQLLTTDPNSDGLADGKTHPGTWFRNKGGQSVIVYQDQNGNTVKLANAGSQDSENDLCQYINKHSELIPAGYSVAPNQSVVVDQDNRNAGRQALPDFIGIVKVMPDFARGTTLIPAKFYNNGSYNHSGWVPLHYSGVIGDQFTADKSQLPVVPDQSGSGGYVPQGLDPTDNLGHIIAAASTGDTTDFPSSLIWYPDKEPTAIYAYNNPMPQIKYTEKIPYEYVNQNNQIVGSTHYVNNGQRFNLTDHYTFSNNAPQGYTLDSGDQNKTVYVGSYLPGNDKAYGQTQMVVLHVIGQTVDANAPVTVLIEKKGTVRSDRTETVHIHGQVGDVYSVRGNEVSVSGVPQGYALDNPNDLLEANLLPSLTYQWIKNGTWDNARQRPELVYSYETAAPLTVHYIDTSSNNDIKNVTAPSDSVGSILDLSQTASFNHNNMPNGYRYDPSNTVTKAIYSSQPQGVDIYVDKKVSFKIHYINVVNGKDVNDVQAPSDYAGATLDLSQASVFNRDHLPAGYLYDTQRNNISSVQYSNQPQDINIYVDGKVSFKVRYLNALDGSDISDVQAPSNYAGATLDLSQDSHFNRNHMPKYYTYDTQTGQNNNSQITYTNSPHDVDVYVDGNVQIYYVSDNDQSRVLGYGHPDITGNNVKQQIQKVVSMPDSGIPAGKSVDYQNLNYNVIADGNHHYHVNVPVMSDAIWTGYRWGTNSSAAKVMFDTDNDTAYVYGGGTVGYNSDGTNDHSFFSDVKKVSDGSSEDPNSDGIFIDSSAFQFPNNNKDWKIIIQNAKFSPSRNLVESGYTDYRSGPDFDKTFGSGFFATSCPVPYNPAADTPEQNSTPWSISDYDSYNDKFASQVKSIDVSGFTNQVPFARNMFASRSDNNNLTTIKGLNKLNTSGISDMSYMFYNDSGLKTLNLNHLNASDVKSMDGMFYSDLNLNTLNLGHFDNSNVTISYSVLGGVTDVFLHDHNLNKLIKGPKTEFENLPINATAGFYDMISDDNNDPMWNAVVSSDGKKGASSISIDNLPAGTYYAANQYNLDWFDVSNNNYYNSDGNSKANEVTNNSGSNEFVYEPRNPDSDYHNTFSDAASYQIHHFDPTGGIYPDGYSKPSSYTVLPDDMQNYKVYNDLPSDEGSGFRINIKPINSKPIYDETSSVQVHYDYDSHQLASDVITGKAGTTVSLLKLGKVPFGYKVDPNDNTQYTMQDYNLTQTINLDPNTLIHFIDESDHQSLGNSNQLIAPYNIVGQVNDILIPNNYHVDANLSRQDYSLHVDSNGRAYINVNLLRTINSVKVDYDYQGHKLNSDTIYDQPAGNVVNLLNSRKIPFGYKVAANANLQYKMQNNNPTQVIPLASDTAVRFVNEDTGQSLGNGSHLVAPWNLSDQIKGETTPNGYYLDSVNQNYQLYKGSNGQACVNANLINNQVWTGYLWGNASVRIDGNNDTITVYNTINQIPSTENVNKNNYQVSDIISDSDNRYLYSYSDASNRMSNVKSQDSDGSDVPDTFDIPKIDNRDVKNIDGREYGLFYDNFESDSDLPHPNPGYYWGQIRSTRQEFINSNNQVSGSIFNNIYKRITTNDSGDPTSVNQPLTQLPNNQPYWTIKVEGGVAPQNSSNLFNGSGTTKLPAQDVISIDANGLNTTKNQVNNMNGMFAGDPNLRGLEINNLDTSQVKRMRGMFQSDKKISNLDLSRFNISQVSDVSSMFKSDQALKDLNLSSFDLERTNSKGQMFDGDNQLNKLNLNAKTNLSGVGQDWGAKFFNDNVSNNGFDSTNHIKSGTQETNIYYQAEPVSIHLINVRDNNSVLKIGQQLAVAKNPDGGYYPNVEGQLADGQIAVPQGTYFLPASQQDYTIQSPQYHPYVNVKVRINGPVKTDKVRFTLIGNNVPKYYQGAVGFLASDNSDYKGVGQYTFSDNATNSDVKGLPANYHIASDQTIPYDGATHQVQIDPNNEKGVVNYVYTDSEGKLHTLKSASISGQYKVQLRVSGRKDDSDEVNPGSILNQMDRFKTADGKTYQLISQGPSDNQLTFNDGRLANTKQDEQDDPSAANYNPSNNALNVPVEPVGTGKIHVDYFTQTGRQLASDVFNGNDDSDLDSATEYTNASGSHTVNVGDHIASDNPDPQDYQIDKAAMINSDYKFESREQYVTVPLIGKQTADPQDHSKDQSDGNDAVKVNIYLGNSQGSDFQHKYTTIVHLNGQIGSLINFGPSDLLNQQDGDGNNNPLYYSNLKDTDSSEIDLTHYVTNPQYTENNNQQYYLYGNGNQSATLYNTLGGQPTTSAEHPSPATVNFYYDASPDYSSDAQPITVKYFDQYNHPINGKIGDKVVKSDVITPAPSDYGQKINVTSSDSKLTPKSGQSAQGMNVPTGYHLVDNPNVIYRITNHAQEADLHVQGNQRQINDGANSDALPIKIVVNVYKSDGTTSDTATYTISDSQGHPQQFNNNGTTYIVRPKLVSNVGDSDVISSSSYQPQINDQQQMVESTGTNTYNVHFNSGGISVDNVKDPNSNGITFSYKIVDKPQARQRNYIHYISYSDVDNRGDITIQPNHQDFPTEVSDANNVGQSFSDNYYRENVPTGYQFYKVYSVNGNTNDSQISNGLKQFGNGQGGPGQEYIEVIPNASPITFHYINQNGSDVKDVQLSGNGSDQTAASGKGQHTSRFGTQIKASDINKSGQPNNRLGVPQGYQYNALTNSQDRPSTIGETQPVFSRDPQDVYIPVVGTTYGRVNLKFQQNLSDANHHTSNLISDHISDAQVGRNYSFYGFNLSTPSTGTKDGYTLDYNGHPSKVTVHINPNHSYSFVNPSDNPSGQAQTSNDQGGNVNNISNSQEISFDPGTKAVTNPPRASFWYHVTDNTSEPLTLIYINQAGQQVGCADKMQGTIGSDVNVIDPAKGGEPVPDHYQLDSNQTTQYRFTDQPRTVYLHIQGQPVTSQIMVYTVAQNSDGTVTFGHQVRSVSGANGSLVSVSPADYYPDEVNDPNKDGSQSKYSIDYSKDSEQFVRLTRNQNGQIVAAPNRIIFYYVHRTTDGAPITLRYINHKTGQEVGYTKVINGNLNDKIDVTSSDPTNGDLAGEDVPAGYTVDNSDLSSNNLISGSSKGQPVVYQLSDSPQMLNIPVKGNSDTLTYHIHVFKESSDGTIQGPASDVALHITGNVGDTIHISPYGFTSSNAGNNGSDIKSMSDNNKSISSYGIPTSSGGYHATNTDLDKDIQINANGQLSPDSNTNYFYRQNYQSQQVGTVRIHYITDSSISTNAVDSITGKPTDGSEVDEVSDKGTVGNAYTNADTFDLSPYRDDIPEELSANYESADNAMNKDGTQIKDDPKDNQWQYSESNNNFTNGVRDVYIQVTERGTNGVSNGPIIIGSDGNMLNQ